MVPPPTTNRDEDAFPHQILRFDLYTPPSFR